MSKVQEKDATLLSNLSGSDIANELDSRLRDLEKNIAVAREFIKLADESYSELRHKWNLLHEEVRNKPPTQTPERAAITKEKTQSGPGNKQHRKTKSRELTDLDESKGIGSVDIPAKPEGRARRVKDKGQPKKNTEIAGEDDAPLGPAKSSQPYRDPGRRRGKTTLRN